MDEFSNPYKPGAGHMPPHLAGRREESEEFRRLIGQRAILENLVLTGLRGVGKTVLLETFKPRAMREGWLWIGTDMSESTMVSEDRLAIRLLTDLSVATSLITILRHDAPLRIGFGAETKRVDQRLDFNVLRAWYERTPGLVADKIKFVLEAVWEQLKRHGYRGLIFAYDEAQNLADSAGRNEYPLSVLLDVFQSIQRKNIPFMLVLTGLPTLFGKLVEARTFAERMFRVVFLDRLDEQDSREAILKPLDYAECPVRFDKRSVDRIVEISGGYPYFIQFICREAYDVFLQKSDSSEQPSVPVQEIIRKMDSDFFAGRWARATDRQRDLLSAIAGLDACDAEFTVQEIVERSQQILDKPFSSSHVNQMLAALSRLGLIYKNRYGKYSFAVPLLGQFILRQIRQKSPDDPGSEGILRDVDGGEV